MCVEYADRLDPSQHELPGGRGGRRSGEAVYLNECVFRAGRRGVEDVVAALAKVQEHAHELTAVQA